MYLLLPDGAGVWIHALLLNYNSGHVGLNGVHDDNQYSLSTIEIDVVIYNMNYHRPQPLHNPIQTLPRNKNLQMYVVYKITKFQGIQQYTLRQLEQLKTIANQRRKQLFHKIRQLKHLLSTCYNALSFEHLFD